MPTIEEQGGWPGIIVSAVQNHYANKSAKKQALSDQQFQDKHDEIQGMIDNLGTKLAAVPEDARNTPDYLKMQDQLAQAIQSRDAHWKSLDHPNALMKFGKMLGKDLRFKKQEAPTPVAPPVYGQPTMDVNGEKIPTGPAYKVQGPQTPAQRRAASEAAQLVASGPVSPEQAATQQGRAESAKSLAEFQGNMKLYDQNHPEGIGPTATPEGKQARNEYVNELLTSGLKEPKEPIDAWTAVKGVDAQKMPDGSYRELQVNKKGEYRYQQMPEGYNPQAAKTKSGTSMFAVSLDTYAKSKGYGSFSEIPEEYKEKVKDYEIRKDALDRTISKKSVVTRLMQDAEGHPFTATVTNYSGPAGNEELVDPMPSKEGAAPSSSGPANATPSPAKTNPSSPNLDKVKKDAKALNTPSAGSGNAKFGPPDTSIQMKTPAITDAQKDLEKAVGLDSLAKQVEKKPNDAFNQKRLAVQLERESGGRFTVQALEYVKQIGWANTLQEWLNKPTTGALPPELVRQLVDGAHENLKAKQDALKAAVQGVGSQEPEQPSNMTDDEFLMKVK